jgi:hypothetical protein
MPTSARHNRARPVTTLVTGLTLLATSCTNNPTDTAQRPPQPAPPTIHGPPSRSPTVAPPASTATPAADTANPTDTAARWLIAYRSATWTDRTPAAWIDRVQPYVTATLHTANQSLRDAGGGTDWAQFIQQRCTSTVTDTTAIIPAESPGTDTAANVVVTGAVHTTCTAGTPTVPAEDASATVIVIKTANGWRVDQRLY